MQKEMQIAEIKQHTTKEMSGEVSESTHIANGLAEVLQDEIVLARGLVTDILTQSPRGCLLRRDGEIFGRAFDDLSFDWSLHELNLEDGPIAEDVENRGSLVVVLVLVHLAVQNQNIANRGRRDVRGWALLGFWNDGIDWQRPCRLTRNNDL